MLNFKAPDPYRTITPFFSVKSVNDTMEFLKTVFNAEVKELMKDDSGRARHAELLIGDSYVMLGESRDEKDKSSAMLYIYVNDADALYKKALDAGAESISEPEDQFYGDRNVGIRDGDGNTWWIAQRKETLTTEEIEKRMKEMSS